MDDTQAAGEQAIPNPPLPLFTMEELQEQLRQKDGMYKKACLAARQAELRAEQAESRLDSKRDILNASKQNAEDELQARLTVLCRQLEEARKGEEEETLRRIQADRKSDAHALEIVEWKRRAEEAEHAKDKYEALERELATAKKDVDDERRKKDDLKRDKEVLLQQIKRLKYESEQTMKVAEELEGMKKKCEVLERKATTLKDEMDEERRKREESNRDKEALLRKNERLTDDLDNAKRAAGDSKKKCEMLGLEMDTLNEEMNEERRNRRKKLEEEIASVKSEANSKLAFLQAQLTELQQQDTNTVQHHSLDEWDGGDCDPAITPSDGVVDTVGSDMNGLAPSTLLTDNSTTGDHTHSQAEVKISNSNPSLLTGPKEESIDVPQEIPNDNKIFQDPDSFPSPTDSMDFGDEPDQPEGDKVEIRRRSSRIAPKPLKPIESMEDSEDDTVPPVKKSRSDSVGKNGNTRTLSGRKNECGDKDYHEAKKNDTELECPQCDFRTRSAHYWLKHLARNHSTTPTQIGLILLCECGVESSSNFHVKRCDIANFTVIKKGQSVKTTPQCVLCEVYPKTAHGYSVHLESHHKSNLRKNGIYLTCSCGLAVRSHNVDPNHTKKCDGLQYSLHKLGE